MKFSSVCVIGLGYIGLPTAAMFATHGKKVIGVDVSEHVVATIQSGRIHIEEPGLERVVRTAVEAGSLNPRMEPAESDAFIIAVPTPKQADNSADLSYVHAAAESLVPYLRPGNLVILESTSPPDTTNGLVPILERSGLVVGEDVLLAHSPERVLPGRIMIELVKNDRVIGGHTPKAAEAGAELYRSFVTGQIHLTDATTAEMAKLMENTFRDVNIALANEFGRIGARVGIDVHEAIRLANFHPRVSILKPGPGVGGHCIAVDPWFIVDAAPEESELIRTARRVNDAQPAYVATLIEKAVAHVGNPTIAILGLAYKADVDDVRESPAIDVVTELRDRAYHVRLHDAYADHLPDGTEISGDLASIIDGADAIVILTDHSRYRELAPESPELAGIANHVIVDARYCIDRQRWIEAGYRVVQVGVADRLPAHVETIA